MVPPPVVAHRRAAEAARRAGEALGSAAGPAKAPAIAQAAADLLTAAANGWEDRRGGRLTMPAEAFDRAAYERNCPVPARHVPYVSQLRSIARLIVVMGKNIRDSDTATVLHLIHALAGLADALADLRDAQRRQHQAQAAQAAASHLRSYRPPPRSESGQHPAPMTARHERYSPTRRPPSTRV
jgi:hypothetical protein